MGNKSNKLTNSDEFKNYYSSVMQPLKYVIKISNNKKIKSIALSKNKCELFLDEGERHCGVIINYYDGDCMELSCDSVESAIIMWYFDNGYDTVYVDQNLREYIKKNL